MHKEPIFILANLKSILLPNLFIPALSLVTWPATGGKATSHLFYVHRGHLKRGCADCQRALFDVWAVGSAKNSVPFHPKLVERFNELIKPVQIHNLVMDFL